MCQSCRTLVEPQSCCSLNKIHGKGKEESKTLINVDLIQFKYNKVILFNFQTLLLKYESH